jgi:hypothetical protein
MNVVTAVALHIKRFAEQQIRWVVCLAQSLVLLSSTMWSHIPWLSDNGKG